MYVSYHLNPEVFESFANGIWIVSVASGILVLGVASVWVTHLAEKLASKDLKNELNSRFYMLKVLIESGVKDLYFFEGTNEHAEEEKQRFRQNFLNLLNGEENNRSRINFLRNDREEICVIAIAFRSCLNGGEIGFGFDDFKNICEKKNKAFRILLLHPFSEPAYTRGTHEHERLKTISEYMNPLRAKPTDHRRLKPIKNLPQIAPADRAA